MEQAASNSVVTCSSGIMVRYGAKVFTNQNPFSLYTDDLCNPIVVRDYSDCITLRCGLDG